MPRFVWLYTLIALPYLSGCEIFSQTEAGAQSSRPETAVEESIPAVDVEIAQTGFLEEPLDPVGNTQPVREVSLRSQVEGRLLDLTVDVGDRVRQGQILARLDDTLLLTAVSEAEAELAARQSEVARAQAQVSNARSQAEQARLELLQAQADAARLESLAQDGAISQQEAELAQTAAATAQQTLNSALEQVRTEQQAVTAAQKRVAAQQAVVAQTKERQSYTLLASPITGVVTERVTEPGNLVTPGSEILKLGDFSRVKVEVPVSELELANITMGQAANVRLDAFANEVFSGEVTQISPAADSTALKVPVEVTIPNSNGRIGSGLSARVNFVSTTPANVIVPETALQAVGDGEDRRTNEGTSEEATVFVAVSDGEQTRVQSRRVQVGRRGTGQVAIASGLQPGERYVVRSSQPLNDGDTVRLSILSE